MVTSMLSLLKTGGYSMPKPMYRIAYLIAASVAALTASCGEDPTSPASLENGSWTCQLGEYGGPMYFDVENQSVVTGFAVLIEPDPDLLGVLWEMGDAEYSISGSNQWSVSASQERIDGLHYLQVNGQFTSPTVCAGEIHTWNSEGEVLYDINISFSASFIQ
jgi:hypothetical protein